MEPLPPPPAVSAVSMSQLLLVPIHPSQLPARPISPRLRSQLVYFATPSGPEISESEYKFDLKEVAQWVEDGVISLVSPLDTANMTEVELDEEQENMLIWLSKNAIVHVKVEDR